MEIKLHWTKNPRRFSTN